MSQHLHPTSREPFRNASVRRLSLGLFLAALVCLAGCSGGKTKTKVSGKVTFKGSPVMGEVAFFPDGKEGKEASSPINPETGAYSITGLALGKYKVAVRPTGGLAGGPTGGPVAGGAGGGGAIQVKDASTDSKKGGVAAPAKYAKPDNGLTFEVTGGDQTNDIDLQP